MSVQHALDRPGLGLQCFHCAAPVPTGTHWRARIEGREEAMCCPGCAAVATMIADSGLGGYYRSRSVAAVTATPCTAETTGDRLDLALFDEPGIQQGCVAPLAGGSVREAHLLLLDLRCGACAWLIEQTLQRQPGVESACVNTLAARLVLRWDAARTPLSTLMAALRAIGYDATPWTVGTRALEAQTRRRRSLAEIAVAGLGMMQVMMYAVPTYLAGPGEISPGQIALMQWASLVMTVPVLLYSAQSIFRAALRSLRHRRLEMDVPVALGLAAAFIGSVVDMLRGSGPVWFDSVTMFVFLLLGARWLEATARERALDATGKLAAALPLQAVRWHAGLEAAGWHAASVAGLVPGDRIRVASGEVIPVDGRVEHGAGLVEEALLTGESVAVWRGPGDAVLAASVNRGPTLEIQVEAAGSQSVLSSLLRQMDQALADRAPLVQAADRAARHFVLGLLILTVVVSVVWCWIDPARALGVAVAILVVSCPCALSLAVPATLAAGTARLSQRGMLILRAHALETLARARTVVFDKTGTLTLGQPEVQIEWLAPARVPPARAAAIAAGLESGQSHPLARAVLARLQADRPGLVPCALESITVWPGLGIEARLGPDPQSRWRIGRPDWVAALQSGCPDAVVDARGAWLGDRHGVVARFGFEDQLKPGAAALVSALVARGLRVVMLSGDHPAGVAQTAQALGIVEARGGLLPDDKRAAIAALRTDGPVVMIGDGLNDAPGLGAADLAIALGAVSQALARGADAVVPSGRLAVLEEAWCEAHSARRRIRQNLAWALGYNLCAIPLAALAWLSPWQAGAGMALSSLCVVLNALRPSGAGPWKS